MPTAPEHIASSPDVARGDPRRFLMVKECDGFRNHWPPGPPGTPFSYTPDTAVIQWHDANGTQSGNLAFFNANADIASVDAIDSLAAAITSVSNLNALTALATLVLDGNAMTTLVLTGCNTLTGLSAQGGTLTSVDATGAPNLANCDVSGNAITSLNVTGLIFLVNLTCGFNQLATITGLSTCTALTTFIASNNQFVTLNLNFLPAHIDALDVSNNALLTTLTATSLVSATNGLTFDSTGIVNLSLPALVTNTAFISVNSCPSMLTFSANSVVAGGNIQFSNNPALTSISMSSATHFSGIVISTNPLLVTLNFNAMLTVGNMQCDANGLVSVSFPAMTTCTLDFYFNTNNSLSSFSAPNWVMAGTNAVNFSFDALDHTSIEGIVRRGIISGVTSYGFEFEDGTNAGLSTLSAQGQTDVADLITAGNTVQTNP